MLNEALEKALTESYEELTGQDIPDYDFSDDFEDKMARLISEQDGNADKKRRRGIILFFAAAAAVRSALRAKALGPEPRRFFFGQDLRLDDFRMLAGLFFGFVRILVHAPIVPSQRQRFR